MATKAKVPAKKPASKKLAQPAAKTKSAAGVKVKAPAKSKPAVKRAAAPAPARSAPSKKSAAVSKTALKPAAKAAPKAAPKVAPKTATKAAAAPATKNAASAAKTSKVSLPTPPVTPVVMPTPKPLAARPAVSASAKDVAAATEYLLTRSANRSEEPVVINGKRLPTEEQLLKMSEADYMNESQLAFFKYRLQQIEKELLANAGETTEHLRETVIVPDPADRATIEEEHALELRTRDRERKLLKKIQSSLAAIEANEYGYCEETGEPIGIPRLLARPTATLSLEAQQRREMKQKLFGD